MLWSWLIFSLVTINMQFISTKTDRCSLSSIWAVCCCSLTVMFCTCLHWLHRSSLSVHFIHLLGCAVDNSLIKAISHSPLKAYCVFKHFLRMWDLHSHTPLPLPNKHLLDQSDNFNYVGWKISKPVSSFVRISGWGGSGYGTFPFPERHKHRTLPCLCWLLANQPTSTCVSVAGTTLPNEGWVCALLGPADSTGPRGAPWELGEEQGLHNTG